MKRLRLPLHNMSECWVGPGPLGQDNGVVLGESKDLTVVGKGGRRYDECFDVRRGRLRRR